VTRFEHYQSGALYGIRYWFEATGDCIPTHAHDSTHAHNIIVLSGSVMLSTERGAVALLTGRVFDFDWFLQHKITALEKAEVLHLFLNGRPEGYERLPPHELRGILE